MSFSLGSPARADGSNPATDKKTSVYFKGDTLEQIRETAARLDRSVSWVLQRAFELSRDQLEANLSHDDL